MKTKLVILSALVLIFGFGSVLAQATDTVKDPDGEKVKKGFSFGAVPAIAYDSDLGFRYGALANFYDYGDGTLYPFYKHSLYVEWSHTTKGSDLKQIKYDSEHLIPGIRVTGDLRLETEQAMDFYGFNGYETMFNQAYSTTGDEDYISRMFYRMDRRIFRARANFQGRIIGRQLRWFAGGSYYNVKTGPVNIEKLNEGKEGTDLLPDVDGLYEHFIADGLIPEEEATGGGVTNLSVGLVADTRDNEPNPNKGIWSEILLLGSPGFLGSNSSYATLVLTHRQYFTLLPNRLTFAYRLNYQTSIAGQTPWYMMNFTWSSYENQEGLGGSKNLRGIMRNRVVGEGYALGNFELRWKFAKFTLLKQNFYLALSPFLDVARITKPYQPFEGFEALLKEKGFYGQADGFHIGYGVGLHIALNQNFIVAVDYGLAANKTGTKDDADKSGIYIGLNFLF